MQKKMKVIAFDCEGQKFSEWVNNEEEAYTWAKNHGLEIFSII